MPLPQPEPRRLAEEVNEWYRRRGKTPVIVAGSAVTGLAFIRSLGGRGVPVFALDHRPWEVGMHSRFAHPVVLPDPAVSPDAWRDFLLEAGELLDCRPVLIPTGDPHLRALVPAAEHLGRSYPAPLPPGEVYEALSEKRRQYALLRGQGVLMPQFIDVAAEADLRAATASVGFPCLLKPGLGDVWVGRSNSKLELVDSPDAALDAFRRMQAAEVGVIVQELIPGGDDAFHGCFCYLGQDGEVRGAFTKRKVRQYPPRFGNGSYQISVDSPETADLTLDLLSRIGYRGVASVEWKRDPRDGRLKLIEINCRAASGTQLAIDSGVDLPWLVYRDLIGDPLPPVTEFQIGRKFINLSWDARAYAARPDRSIGAFTGWMRSVLQARSHAVVSVRDPGPMWSMLRRAF